MAKKAAETAEAQRLLSWQFTMELLVMDLRAKAGLEPLSPAAEAYLDSIEPPTAEVAAANEGWRNELTAMWAQSMKAHHGTGGN